MFRRLFNRYLIIQFVLWALIMAAAWPLALLRYTVLLLLVAVYAVCHYIEGLHS